MRRQHFSPRQAVNDCRCHCRPAATLASVARSRPLPNRLQKIGHFFRGNFGPRCLCFDWAGPKVKVKIDPLAGTACSSPILSPRRQPIHRHKVGRERRGRQRDHGNILLNCPAHRNSLFIRGVMSCVASTGNQMMFDGKISEVASRELRLSDDRTSLVYPSKR